MQPQKREELWVLGEIAGEAAHELRNALAVIAGSASLLRAADASQRDALVAKIERNVRLAQAVVDALMALARGEAVRGEQVAIANVIAEARRDVTAVHAPTYADEVGAALAVRGSEVLLSRMFRVLYDNAIQAAGPRAAHITTRASKIADEVIIDIEDDGPGVPTEIATTLFEPLVTTKPAGTGLGLSLVRRVARAHGGDATFVGGSHFRIVLR